MYSTSSLNSGVSLNSSIIGALAFQVKKQVVANDAFYKLKGSPILSQNPLYSQNFSPL